MADFIETDVFKKLNQLDRIEYMLGLERIKKKYSYGASLILGVFTFFWVGLFILIFITGYSTFGIDLVIKIAKSFIFSLRILIFFIILLGLYDIYISTRGFIAKRKFNKEFFKIEVKKK